MNKQILPLVCLLLGMSFTAGAQTKEKSSKEKNDVTTQKKSSSDKTTIVIDGNNITVNGKSIDELKESDVELLNQKGMSAILPRIKNRIRSNGGLKFFEDGFNLPSNRALLGVQSEKSDKGAKITSVEPESAAEKAGLKKEDVITKVGDTKIDDSQDLFDAIGKYKPEEKVAITYIRDGKTATANATLGKNISSGNRVLNLKGDVFSRDFNNGFDFDMPQLRNLDRLKGVEMFSRKPKIGLEIQDVEEGKGVKILDVDDDSPAAKAGLQKNDVISDIDGKSTDSVDDLRSQLRDLKEGDSCKITYKRGGQTQSAVLKLPKKLKTAEL